MFDYPFRVPARFALIIRAVVSQEGLALRLDPNFRIIAVAYPYVARRLLAGDTSEMREKLLEVIFDESGRLRLIGSKACWMWWVRTLPLLGRN